MPPRLWDMKEAQKLADSGMGVNDIGKSLGVGRHAIYSAIESGQLTRVSSVRGKIDLAELRQMIRDRKTAGEICAHFGVSNSSLTKFRHAHDVPTPVRTYNGRPAAPLPEPAPPKPAKPGPAVDARTAALIATGGRYADLRAWAKEYGTTETKARQCWHNLRLLVAKGGSA